MSSDTFYIEIREIEGDTVELLCTTSTAGGVNDYAATRSFVLMVLEDGMPFSRDTPLQKRLLELGGGQMPALWEEAFHREHVGEFVASAELVERIGVVGDEHAWRARFDHDDATAERDYPLHRFVLRARMTDPRWLTGLQVGDRYGTTAFDAWWDDPTRQSREQYAAIERKASRWRPPGKAAKRPTTPAASKKTATKKTAAKKTAAKKTATKKPATKKPAAKKPAAKKPATKKPATKKTATKKTATKKTATKKTATKKRASKAASKKTPAKKTAARKTAKRA